SHNLRFTASSETQPRRGLRQDHFTKTSKAAPMSSGSVGFPMGGLGTATGVISPLIKLADTTIWGAQNCGNLPHTVMKPAVMVKAPSIGKSISKSALPLESVTMPVPLRRGPIE